MKSDLEYHHFVFFLIVDKKGFSLLLRDYNSGYNNFTNQRKAADMKKLLSARGIALLSIIPLLFLCLNFSGLQHNKNKIKAIHTFLVKIPSSSGVCPYQLMMMSKGKLQMINDPQCVCPYAHGTSFQSSFYMTIRSTDEKTVRTMLPECIRNEVEINTIDKPSKKAPAELPQELYSSIIN